jgi:hypothetical protein
VKFSFQNMIVEKRLIFENITIRKRYMFFKKNIIIGKKDKIEY